MLQDGVLPEPNPDLASWFADAAPGWPEAVLPAYDGGSIANLPHSILAAFDSPQQLRRSLLPAVAGDILPGDLLAGARVVVLIVIDGLGALAVDDLAKNGDLPALESAPHRAQLTSVFPATTAAATTSLQYGVAPGAHGMAGYTLYLPEIDDVFNMITWKVAGKREETAQAPAPEDFLAGPHLFALLERAGIDCAIVSNAAFAASPLTRAQASGVRYRGYRTLAEFSHRLLREVERPGRRFVFGYWDGYDALGHTWGTNTEIARLEARLIDQALREGFFTHLNERSDDIAVLVTADHGHTPTPRNRRIDLSTYPQLINALSARPTGEPRQIGLSFREGKALDPSRINAFLRERGVAVDMDAAIAAGLYGPTPHHPELSIRTGRTLLLAREGGAFQSPFPGGSSGSLGGHGSLTPSEMRVPLLGWRYPA